MAILSKLNPFPNAVKKTADDAVEGASEVGRNTTRPIAAAILGTGAVGSGAYVYGEQQETQQEQQKSQRYQEYQDRVAEIERLRRMGEITAEEAERRKQQAWDAYRASTDGNEGMTVTEFLASLGQFQFLGLSLAASVFFYAVAPKILDALAAAPGLEALLG